MCFLHAKSCIDEYREKLGWRWKIRLRDDMPVPPNRRWLLDIKSNGSKWLGEEPDTIDVLLEVLASRQLDDKFAPFFSDADAPDFWCHNLNPYKGVKGIVHFFGNFATVSYVFSVFTNDPAVIGKLTAAIEKNLAAEWPDVCEETIKQRKLTDGITKSLPVVPVKPIIVAFEPFTSDGEF